MIARRGEGRPYGRPSSFIAPHWLASLVAALVLALLAACATPAGGPVGPDLGGQTAVTPFAPATLPPPPVSTRPASNGPTPGPFPSPAYGIHLSQWWHLEALAGDLALVQEMGFGWVKQKFPWREIEGAAKGEYNWYRPDEIVAAVEQANLQLVVRLDGQPLWSVASLPDEQITSSQPPVNFQDFGDYCRAVAGRYRGRIAAYQIWNEPNLSREWGNRSPDPVEYTALLRTCYEGIKAADPGAIVISAGLAPTGTQPPVAMPDEAYLRGMYAAGAAAYFDVLGLNAPGYKAPPEVPPEAGVAVEGYGGHRWNVFRHVEDMRRIMVENGDAGKQVAILEMGWMIHQTYHEAYTWHGVTERQQADYLAGAYRYARENWQPWIGLMTTIYIADRDWQPETHEQYWWSIVLPDGTRRPAFDALRGVDKG